MNKKGFTLVELLAVMVILAIIIVIAFPRFSGVIEEARLNIYRSQELLLKSATKLYLAESNETINTNTSIVKNISDLSDFISPIKDQITSNNCLAYVTITNVNGVYAYNPYLNCDNYTTEGYVNNNGLVLWLDGSDFSNSPATNPWVDRISSNSGTPTNFGYTIASGSDALGAVAFDGTNDYINFPTTINLGTNWTIDVKLKTITQSKNFEFFIGTSANSGSVGKILLRYNGNVSYSYPANTYNNFNVTTAEIDNQIKTLTFVSNSSTVKMYVDGVLRDTKNIVNAPMVIGTLGNAWSDLAWLARFNLYSLRCYNRALSDTEILENYQFNQ